MTTMDILSWISTLSTCSTMLTKADIIEYSDQSSIDYSLVHSDSPWSLIDSIAVPGCVTLLLEEISEFDQAFEKVARSRLTINMILITSDASSVNDTLKDQQRLDLNVLVRNMSLPERIGKCLLYPNNIVRLMIA